MNFLIAILGILQILAGALIYLAAQSAIHETLAATSFGLGVIALALCVVIQELKGIGQRIDAREAGDIERHQATTKIANAFERLGQKREMA